MFSYRESKHVSNAYLIRNRLPKNTHLCQIKSHVFYRKKHLISEAKENSEYFSLFNTDPLRKGFKHRMALKKHHMVILYSKQK